MLHGTSPQPVLQKPRLMHFQRRLAQFRSIVNSIVHFFAQFIIYCTTAYDGRKIGTVCAVYLNALNTIL